MGRRGRSYIMDTVKAWVTLERIPIFTDHRKGGADMGKDALNWKKNKNAKRRLTKDVSIRPWSWKEMKGIRITFVSREWVRFALNKRIIIALHGHRIYFKGDEMGYTLCLNGGHHFIRINGEDLYEFAKRYEGCYTLHQDTKDGPRYIDVFTENRDIV